jgi:FkbM family methyltransferase
MSVAKKSHPLCSRNIEKASARVSNPVTLKIPGVDPALVMHLHDSADIHISEQLRSQGIWEPYETRLLCELLQPGQRFVDAGANIGYFTLLAAFLVGESGQVFAFEPEPRNMLLLTRSLEANRLSSRVVAEQAGLSERDGQALLHLHPANKGDHQLPRDEQERRIMGNVVADRYWNEARNSRFHETLERW